MKKLIFTAFILLGLTSCRKSTLTGDHFIFGSSYSECAGNCVNYFMIKKGELYPDNMNAAGDKLVFKNQKLSKDKYNLAKQLLDQLPDYLKNSSSTNYGCPDCRDQGKYYIEIKENSSIKKFQIDTDTSQVPKEIRVYLAKLESVLKQL